MITNPVTLSMLTGVFVALLGIQLDRRKLSKNDWETVVHPELSPKRDEIGNAFYERNLKPRIEENRSLYDQILRLLGIDEETVARQMDQARWNKIRPEELIAFRVAALLLGAAFAVITLVMFQSSTGFMLGIAIMALSQFYPQMKLKEMIKKRQREIKRNLPDFIDLLIVLLEVGTPEQDAILQVSDSFKDATGEEFRRAATQAAFNNGRWTDALGQMAQRVQLEEVTDLVSSITVAAEKGTALSPILREQVARIRYRQQQDYEEKAAKAGTKMLPIMLLFILVPMIVILIAPGFF